MTARPGARTLATLALVCALVLAGCSSGSTTPTADTADSPAAATTGTGTPDRASPTSEPSPTPGPSPTASVTPAAFPCESPDASTPAAQPDPSSVSIAVAGNASLPFDPNLTYVRTMRLLGGPDADPPERVNVYETDPYRPAVEEPFARTLLDARAEAPPSDVPRGLEGPVIPRTGEESDLLLEFTVAHEFTHGAQFQTVDDSPAFEAAFADEYQQRWIGAALIEGGASYTGVEYAVRHSDYSRERILDETDQYRDASPAGKYAWAAYHFGQRYVESRVDSPAEHWCVYRDPPETTEELVHGLDPGSEPVRDLAVDVDADGWTEVGRESRGELFTRVVLAAELPESRAAEGAAGWGNDELVALERDGERGYVWTLRWDTDDDAGEFLETFATAMDARNATAEDGGRWTANETVVRVERVAPETVVVVTGPASFVSAVDAEGSNESVAVTVAG